MDSKTITAVIDSIEGRLAVLEINGEYCTSMPVKLLPKAARPGAILDIKILINKNVENKQKNKILKLQKILIAR